MIIIYEYLLKDFEYCFLSYNLIDIILYLILEENTERLNTIELNQILLSRYLEMKQKGK